MSKHSQSPCFEDDDGNDHLFISLDENSPKRVKWGPAKLFMPEGCNIQPSTTAATQPSFTTPEVSSTASKMRFAQPPATTTASQPSTTTAAASQPSTTAPEPSAAAGSPLGRDGERGQRTYKTVGSWELGGGVKASVVQSSDGAFVNIRQFSCQNRPTMDGVCMSSTTWDYFSEKMLDFIFGEKNSSFVSNNLIIALSEEDGVCLQNIYKSGLYCKDVYKLRAYNIKLKFDQWNVLKNIIFDVSTCLFNLQ
ncbi:hypothetical protein AVEN_252423-1 [Araneus ventricosus]|uniref:Uncharacterized protein n=1 Tax=Araneus ventricosus TaxID=182803 RepID=A0A4Y2AR43_ARAVE|nr:hypothetical protein AVEN_252423-1 [Araneus ventricosus]